MEIRLLNVSSKKGKPSFKNLNLKIKSGSITGIYQDNLNIIVKLLLNELEYTGSILVDERDIKEFNSELISYIDTYDREKILTKKVSDEFFLVKKNLSMIEKSYLKKAVSSLTIVGLNESYLEKEFMTLSKSEKRLVQIALKLVINPDILIIKEPFLYLDKNSKNTLLKLILDLKKKYKKTIIIISEDINILYELSNDLIIFKDNKVLVSNSTFSIFEDLPFLENNQIELPNYVLFNKIAKEYNIKLKRTKDVKDLIKDVYKNVCEIKKET